MHHFTSARPDSQTSGAGLGAEQLEWPRGCLFVVSLVAFAWCTQC